jgi:putative ABC transport system substrate-binding protein
MPFLSLERGMRRREFIGGLVGGAATWPVAAKAQQTMPVIGFLNGASPDKYAPYLAAFHQGLKEEGYVEGRNLAIEYRWAEGRYDQLPAMAADLVRRQVAVIAATSTPANTVAKAATKTIPIVFTTASDPVQIGLVASLRRPGGNVTGATQLGVEVGAKRLELAHELIPAETVFSLLVNPSNPSTETFTRDLKAAATKLGRQLNVLKASTEEEINAAFATFLQQRVGVLIIATDAFFNGQSKQLAALTVRHSVPAIYQYREFTAAGGLASYGGSNTDAYRQAGNYTGRVLKGEKPADLPVLRSTKVELIVNLKAAKALGLTIPTALLVRADEVIE